MSKASQAINSKLKTIITDKTKTMFNLINSEKEWMSPGFNQRKSACLSLLSELSYCTTCELDKGTRRRLKIIPSNLFRSAMTANHNGYATIESIVSESDYKDFKVHVLYSNKFVAILVYNPAQKLLLVGVRGTQFLYDWGINFDLSKKNIYLTNDKMPSLRPNNHTVTELCFHEGFLIEAIKLRSKIEAYIIDEKLNNHDLNIYLTGHSLGGAIAAILYNFQSSEVPVSNDSIYPKSCYTFAAPKIGDFQTLILSRQPYAIRRLRDIVPNVPPAMFSYSYFFDERMTDGNAYADKDYGFWYFAKWIACLRFNILISDHSIEHYVEEIIHAAQSLGSSEQ